MSGKGIKPDLGVLDFLYQPSRLSHIFLLVKVSDLFPFPGSSIIAVLTFLIPLVVLGFVTYYVNLDKNEITKHQIELDELISTKEQELDYHQDLVSRR